MSTDGPKKNDYKTIGTAGIGGAAIVTLLINFQQQGITMISDNQKAQTRLVMQKTETNLERIEKNEKALDRMEARLDVGFSSLRDQIRDDIEKLRDVILADSKNRYTHEDHQDYTRQVEIRMKRIETDIERVRRHITEK